MNDHAPGVHAQAVDQLDPDEPSPSANGGHGGRSPGRWWRSTATWLYPSLLTAILTLWNIGYPEIWWDEFVTVEVARRPLGQIWSLLHNVDAVHGAYYLVMHFWIAIFGDSVVSLRLPSALAMTGAAACVGGLGERLFGRAAGVTAGLAFAVLPAVTRFGQEVRSYAFVVLAAALASLLLFRALDRPSVPRWAAYCLGITACMYFNLVAGAIVVGHVLAVATWLRGRWRTRAALGFATAVVTSGALALPLVQRAVSQAPRQIAWIQDGNPIDAWRMAVMSTAVAYALVVLAVLAWARPTRATAMMTAAAIAPLLAVWLYSLGEFNYFFGKYLLFTLPAWAVLAGAGIVAVRWKYAAVVGVVVLAAIGTPDQLAARDQLSHSWFNYPGPRRPDAAESYSGAARIVADHYQPGDGIVYERGGHQWYRMIDIGVRYYLPDDTRLRDVFLGTPAADRNDLYATECGPECLGDEQRLWIIVAGETDRVLDRFSPAQREGLDELYVQTWTGQVTGLTVALLERRTDVADP